MYTVEKVKDSTGLIKFIELLKKNDHNEHDCERSVYIDHMITTVYQSNWHRITLLYDGKEAVGYLVVRLDDFLCTEITVLDVFIVKDHQGKGCIDVLLGDMIPHAFEANANRIKWDSRVFDTEFWDKRAYGVKIESYKVFYVTLNDKSENAYKKGGDAE